MSTRHPTLGGQTRAPRIKPPVLPIIPITCDCQEVVNLIITPNTSMIVAHCKNCHSLLRYFPKSGGATIETIEAEL
jgi:hypothetical protein